jgi:hypothetical protein
MMDPNRCISAALGFTCPAQYFSEYAVIDTGIVIPCVPGLCTHGLVHSPLACRGLVTEAPVFSKLPRLPTLIGQFVVGVPCVFESMGWVALGSLVVLARV